MPEFISKLQFKTYEKGEYSDEKVRSLEETLSLIKDFPWDGQRGADVQLTGPSVTIQDENSNYLKAALYFGGKFCLYYLDCDHHLYEYHTSELKEVYATVTDFFNGEIDLHKFDKTVLSMGSIKHFETAPFNYRVLAFSFYSRLIFSIIFILLMVLSSIMIVVLNSPVLFKVIFLPLDLSIIALILYSTFMQVMYYIKSKNMVLNIAQGTPVFKFGNNEEMQNYNKADVSEINIYGRNSSKGTPVLNIIEVNFKNGSKIKFPGLLIDPFLLESKFTNTKINRFIKSAEIRKSMWDYAMNN